MQMLVVDDDPVYRGVFTRFARKMGQDPIVASDGQEALELYVARRPRLVLSDWMMPRLSGVELCRRIREHGAPERPYVILVTSLSTDEHVVEGFQAGADDYVAKPFVHAIFESRVNAAVEVIRGAFAAEERIHRELVVKCQSALGHEHPELASSLEALSRIYVEQRAHAKARAFLRRQIDIAAATGDEALVQRLRRSIEDVHALEEGSRRAQAEPWDVEPAASTAE